MIEVIYKDEKQEAKGNEGIFSMPRNIRQIGLINGDCRIYMEDYVYTFLTRTAGAGECDGTEKSCMAVLTGDAKWDSGVIYVFIKGAFSVEPEELSAEHIEFTEELWQKIHEGTEEYFQGQDIVGWFFAEKLLSMDNLELFQKIHQKHFGAEKVLMLMDPEEREEIFFRYENNVLVKQKGYYLYYEKNPQMQAYMIEKNPDYGEKRREEVPDEAVRAFRKIIQKKKNVEEKETEETEERTSVFSYAATACLTLAVIAAGAKFYQNYQSMQAVNARTEAVSAVIEEKEKKAQNHNSSEKQIGKTMKGEQIEKNTDKKEKIETGDTESLIQKTEKNTKDMENRENKENRVEGKEKEQISGEKREFSPEDEAIYKEESDVRKAERRVQEARKKEQSDINENDKEVKANSAQINSVKTPERGKSYIIRPGDTLYQISIENYGNMDAVSQICRMNGISEDEIIYPGQIIVLP